LCVDLPDTAIRFTMKRWACDLIDVTVDNGPHCLSQLRHNGVLRVYRV
jgi:hypothetical protein